MLLYMKMLSLPGLYQTEHKVGYIIVKIFLSEIEDELVTIH